MVAAEDVAIEKVLIENNGGREWQDISRADDVASLMSQDSAGPTPSKVADMASPDGPVIDRSRIEEVGDAGDSITPAAASEILTASDVPNDAYGPLNGGVEEEISLDEVLQQTLQCHPVLRARRHEVGIARARLTEAGLIPNPELTLDTETPVHDGGPTEMTTRVMFTIPLGGKRRLRQEVARAGICRAQIALSREAEEILSDAADAAVDVLYFQELVDLRSRLSAAATKMIDAARRRPGLDTNITEIELSDRIQADIDAAQMEADRLEAQRLLAVARSTLSQAMGLPPSQLMRVRGELVRRPTTLMPLPSVLAIARCNKPELAEAQMALTESRREQALACAEAKPDLALGPRYQDRIGEADDKIGGRIQVELPVFDRNQGGIEGAAAEVRANAALLNAAEINALGDVAVVYRELESLGQSMEFYSTEVEDLIDRNETLLREPTMRRTISGLQVAQVELQLLKLRLRQLQLRYRYQQLLTRLELFLGHSISDAEQPEPEAANLLPSDELPPELLPTPEPLPE